MSGFTQWFVDNVYPVLAPLLPIIVPILLAYLGRMVLSFYQTLPMQQRTIVRDAVNVAVEAVEQAYPDYTDGEKKAKAEEFVSAQLASHGVKVSPEMWAAIDPIIESAVLSLHQALAQTPNSPPIDGFHSAVNTIPRETEVPIKETGRKGAING